MNEVKLFKTDNNITMLECKPYNWIVDYMYADFPKGHRLYIKENRLTFVAHIGSYGELKNFSYDPLKQLLVVGNLSISIDTFEDASKFIHKCVIGCEKDEDRKDNFTPEGRNIFICKPEDTNNKFHINTELKKDFDKLYQEYIKLLRKQKLERV